MVHDDGTRDDERYLDRCLELARQGRYTTSPNPLVGAVVVREGRIVAEGFHERLGEPHAERNALAGLPAAVTAGAALYVNLEPCSHSGRTPPCVEAVIESGVARVVVCTLDPNPTVSGAGLSALEEAGIEVAVGGRALEAVRLNMPFFCRHLLGRPAVTLKWAMSLDGKIATRTGESQWISSAAGRDWALDLREEHDAILVGSGTALADDPRLDRRRGLAAGDIVKVVLDRRLRLSADAAILRSAGPTLVFTATGAPGRADGLRAAGATVVELESVALDAVLQELSRRGVQSLLVEGGGEVLAAFARDRLFERVAVCCAPRLIGGAEAPGPLRGAGVDTLAQSASIERLEATPVGPDVVLSAWRAGAAEELTGLLGRFPEPCR